MTDPIERAEGTYLDTQMDAVIVAALGFYAAEHPRIAADVRQLAKDYAHALTNDTWLLETATPPKREEGEVPYWSYADAPLPDVVVPTPDDPKYTQVFDLMLTICEGLKSARDFEGTGDLNMAEGVWDEEINPKLDEVFKLLAPPPVVPPKQFHSGWNVPTFEPSFTCAGTWLECFTHLDTELKQRQADGPPYEQPAREAREELWSLADGERAGWARNGDEVFWIMELPGVSASA